MTDDAADQESAFELLGRGRELMRRRHHAQAVVVLKRAARLEPGKGSILEALGHACFNSGQHGRASEVFKALLEVDPSSPYGHFALGQSLRKLGRDRDAWTHLRLAVALEPTRRSTAGRWLASAWPGRTPTATRMGTPVGGVDEPGGPSLRPLCGRDRAEANR